LARSARCSRKGGFGIQVGDRAAAEEFVDEAFGIMRVHGVGAFAELGPDVAYVGDDIGGCGALSEPLVDGFEERGIEQRCVLDAFGRPVELREEPPALFRLVGELGVQTATYSSVTAITAVCLSGRGTGERSGVRVRQPVPGPALLLGRLAPAHRREPGIVAKVEEDAPAQRLVLFQHRPAAAAGWVALIVALPRELHA
jgi:hypothetical protein